MDIHLPQNPGIGGLDELTIQEELTIQQIAGLGDPNADRILFWDDSAGSYQFLTVGSGLSITGTTITATSSGTGDVVGPASSTDNAIVRFDGTTGKLIQNSGITIADGATGSLSGTNTGDQNIFSTIAVSGQSNVVADSTSDTLTLVAGTNITITTDASTDSITISSSGGSSYTDEEAQDAVGTILTDTATIDFTYTDATPSITADVKDGSITNAKVASGIDAVKIGSGDVSNTEFGYLDGVTSAIQTQIDGKQPLDSTLTALAAYNTQSLTHIGISACN